MFTSKKKPISQFGPFEKPKNSSSAINNALNTNNKRRKLKLEDM
jgi:hypothetical protein